MRWPGWSGRKLPIQGLSAVCRQPGGSDRAGLQRPGVRLNSLFTGPADGMYYGRSSPRDGG
jgi:hypothetical protein